MSIRLPVFAEEAETNNKACIRRHSITLCAEEQPGRPANPYAFSPPPIGDFMILMIALMIA